MIYPIFAMVFMTFGLMFLTFITRVRAVRSGEIQMDYFQLFQGQAESDRVRVTSRHYTNLFEAPVLFYTAAVLAIALNLECNVLPIVAWCFVGFRAVHSFIHLTYNKVGHRVLTFMASNACLVTMWVIIAYQHLINS